ncbi:hypothetical protein O3P69_001379 [Scylla paramamosain]|uniref:Uncharacterized protein n=1 Tax=Scylla paramamosain TaxID=85552 RepID=A0AAW0UQ07_SCYPA
MGHWGLSGEPITGEGHRHLSLMGGESHVGISVGGEKRGGGRQVEDGGWRACRCPKWLSDLLARPVAYVPPRPPRSPPPAAGTASQ